MEKRDLQLPHTIKKTKQREDVFRVLSESAVPLNAMDIYEKLRGKNTSTCEANSEKSVYAISTIYRTLQTFEKHDLVEKSVMVGSDMAVYTLKAKDHIHYAICLKCHKMVPMKHCPYEHIHFEEDEFTVTNHKIEVYGYCKKCGENVN